MARFDVLRENENAQLRMVGPDRLRGDETLVRVRRRHPDVDDRDVRPIQTNLSQQSLRVFCLTYDVDACVLQQAG